jgi:predicted ATPase
VSILVTSRARLNLADEYVFSVPALPLPDPGATPAELRRCDAVALFLDRATSARPAFTVTDANGDDVAELCIRLDGLPLALELAAARLTLLSPRGIVDRLARRLDLLRSTAPDVAPRHRTLRAALEWSHDLLPPPVQVLFAGLGVFVGGFGVDAAEKVAGDGDLDVVDGVESLLVANLLRPSGVVGDEPRFGMLETIREYALDRAAHSGRRAELRDRHARWCLDLAEQAEAQLRGPEQLLWLERLAEEHDNLRAALEWAADDGDPDVGLRTGAALWRFWQVRGHLDEGRRRMERLLGSGLGSAPARAAAELTLARCAFIQGDFAALQRYFQACVPLHRERGDDHSSGFALMIMGAATSTRGDTDQGLALLHEALDLARRSADRWLEASCLGYLGVVLASAADFTAASDSLEEGLRSARELGDHRCVGWMSTTLGRIARAAGDRDRASTRVAEAMSVQQRLGDVWGISNALCEHAALAIDEGDHGTARNLLTECVSLALSVHDRPSIAAGLDQLARLAAANNQPDRSAQLLGCIAALHRALNDPLSSRGRADGWVTALHATLDENAFTDAWDRGRAMTLREAVAYALDEADPDLESTSVRT